MSEGHNYSIRFGGQPQALPHSSFHFFFSGTLATMPPSSMKELFITGTVVKVDVAAIEWPANTTALVYDGGVLVCRTTDPDESKEGAEMIEIRIKCGRDQVIGTSSAWRVINT
jgi:hypothetical protein